MPHDQKRLASVQPFPFLRTSWVSRFATARTAWITTAALAMVYLIVVGFSSAFAYQDAPNHLARAEILADLLFRHGTRFGQQFHYHFLPVPYVAGDLFLATAVELLGPRAGMALWNCTVLASLPLALLYCLRSMRVPAEGQLLAVLIATYLGTDLFFIKGFFEFRLAVSLTIIAFTLCEQLRSRWSNARFWGYAAVLVLGYLVHLTAVVFAGFALGVSALVRLRQGRTRLHTEVLLFAPVVLLMAYDQLVVPHFRQPGDEISGELVWGTLGRKFWGIMPVLHRYGGRIDELCRLLFLGCLYAIGRGHFSRTALRAPAVRELSIVAGAFLLLYIALPWAYSAAWFVDVRALALMFLFLLLALLRLRAGATEAAPRAGAAWAVGAVGAVGAPRSAGAGATVLSLPLVLAVALAFVNLAYLARYYHRIDWWAQHYLAIVARVPNGAPVLPITTTKDIQPYLHAGSSIVSEREGLIPYLFSADRGDPMKYFRYRHRPYAPDEDWYFQAKDPDPRDARKPKMHPNWQRIACEYRFLLLTRPFKYRFLHVATVVVAENSSAALLAIAPDACRRTPIAVARHD